MFGYRCLKNLTDLLVRAHIPFLEGDEILNPSHRATTQETSATLTPNTTGSGLRQTTLDRFLTTTTPSQARTMSTPTTQIPKHPGTSIKERGYSFCNNVLCKYCKLLCKTGKITSKTTNETYNCMKNISCISSNLIYCLSCQHCGKQYVGQTLRRIKDRLSEHLRDIDQLNKEKPLGAHFSQKCRVNPSIRVHILEFIKKPPRSPEALTIRNRIEKRWIHLLKTPAPLGLNLED